ARAQNAQSGNLDNGLVPAWSTPEGVPMAPPNTGHPTHHQLDSCRTPFRLGQDYCWNDEPRARDYLTKSARFFTGVHAANISDGYDLSGAAHPEFASPPAMQAASFVGPAAVAAMVAPDFA